MAYEPITTKVIVNTDAISAQVDNLIDDTTMLLIHSEFERIMEKYVPFLSGTLAQTAQPTPQGVVYNQPYAHYQYVGQDFNFTKTVHPLATAFWDKVMMQNEGDVFTRKVEEILRRRAKELYG